MFLGHNGITVIETTTWDKNIKDLYSDSLFNIFRVVKVLLQFFQNKFSSQISIIGLSKI